MSHHNDVPVTPSHPVLWTVCLVGFIAVVVAWFAHMFDGGVEHAKQITLEVKAPSGPGEPDHAAYIDRIVAGDGDLLKLGKAVYNGNCTKCHGVDGGQPQPGYAARNFLAENMQNGATVWQLYRTLVNGYNAMPAQGGLDPEEKYAVIHYIREAFIKPNNPAADVNAPAVPEGYAAAWQIPAPGAGGGADSGPAAWTKPIEIPVAGAMAALVKEGDTGTEARAKLVETGKVLGGQLGEALVEIGENPKAGNFAKALVKAFESGTDTDVVDLLADPGRNHHEPALALLTANDLAAVRKLVRPPVKEAAQ